MIRMRYSQVIAVTACMLGSIACDADECQCHPDFEALTIHVTDSSGAPVSGLTSTTVRLRDMKDVSPPKYPSTVGDYVVVDDLDLDYFSDSPEDISFGVSGPAGSASTTGNAYTDSCHCHVFETTIDAQLIVR